MAWWELVGNRFRQALDYARVGQAVAPAGSSATVQLVVQEACAWSHLGDRLEGEDALRRGAAALARLPTPEHPEHHFVFDETKFSFYGATCSAWLGRAKRPARSPARNHVRWQRVPAGYQQDS